MAKPRWFDKTSVREHIKCLTRQRDHLSQLIRQDDAGDKVLAYRCEEWNALTWALGVLNTLCMAGGFNENKDP